MLLVVIVETINLGILIGMVRIVVVVIVVLFELFVLSTSLRCFLVCRRVASAVAVLVIVVTVSLWSVGSVRLVVSVMLGFVPRGGFCVLVLVSRMLMLVVCRWLCRKLSSLFLVLSVLMSRMVIRLILGSRS